MGLLSEIIDMFIQKKLNSEISITPSSNVVTGTTKSAFDLPNNNKSAFDMPLNTQSSAAMPNNNSNPNEKALELWVKTWSSDIHKTEYARKRIESAKTTQLTPIKIDKNEMCGFFSGKSGKYKTFLNFCPCMDFQKNNQPCKHIYRLAIELGVLNESAKSDSSAIQTPAKSKESLDVTIDLVEQLSEEAQHTLQKIATNVRSTTPTFDIIRNASLDELLKSGLVRDTSPGKHKIKFGLKAQIAELLDSEHIEYSKGAKKVDLENLCYSHIYDKAIEVFPEIIPVTIPDKYSSVKIHWYLHRKFDEEEYFDEHSEDFITVPLLKTDLPNDDVTQQLIKHGYY